MMMERFISTNMYSSSMKRMDTFDRRLFLLPKIRLLAIILFISIQSVSQAASIESARTKFQAGQFKSAMSETNTLLKANSRNSSVLFLRAQIQSESQQVDSAIQSYRQLIDLDPSHLQAYNNLAALYAQKGELKLASETLEQAIKTDPVFTTIYTNLRTIYMDLSQKYYRQALKLKPENTLSQIATIDVDNGVDQILSEEVQVVPQSIQEAINTTVATGPTDSSKTRTTRLPKDIKTAATTPVIPVPMNQPASATLPVLAPKPKTKTKTNVVPKPKPVANVVVAPKPSPSPKPKTRPKPKAKPEVVPVKVADHASQVRKALLSWANAWSNRDAAKYVKAYVGTYTTQGKSHEDWIAGRRWNFKNKKYIQVTLSNISVKADGRTYRASFRQKYDSNTYKDAVNKQLIFVLKGGRWLISKEISK
jgi:tetratricopeptide (TPR) repeat protein